MVLVPALHEALSAMAEGIDGMEARGGRRSASSRLSSAPSLAYAADSSNLPLAKALVVHDQRIRATRSGRSSKARAEDKAFRARALEFSYSPVQKLMRSTRLHSVSTSAALRPASSATPLASSRSALALGASASWWKVRTARLLRATTSR